MPQSVPLVPVGPSPSADLATYLAIGSQATQVGAPPDMSTRGQKGPAGLQEMSGGAAGLRSEPSLPFTAEVFDQLLFSPQPAEGQTGTELLAADGARLFSGPFSRLAGAGHMRLGHWVNAPGPATLFARFHKA